MNKGESIKFTKVGFTDEEIKFFTENPIKSICGVCDRDTTGLSCDDMKCLNDKCPCKYSEC